MLVRVVMPAAVMAEEEEDEAGDELDADVDVTAVERVGEVIDDEE